MTVSPSPFIKFYVMCLIPVWEISLFWKFRKTIGDFELLNSSIIILTPSSFNRFFPKFKLETLNNPSLLCLAIILANVFANSIPSPYYHKKMKTKFHLHHWNWLFCWCNPWEHVFWTFHTFEASPSHHYSASWCRDPWFLPGKSPKPPLTSRSAQIPLQLCYRKVIDIKEYSI